MKARGKREAKRSASPLVSNKEITKEACRAEIGPLRNTLFRPCRAHTPFGGNLSRGDALRFASRLPLAFIFRAFGAMKKSSLWGFFSARPQNATRYITSDSHSFNSMYGSLLAYRLRRTSSSPFVRQSGRLL